MEIVPEKRDSWLAEGAQIFGRARHPRWHEYAAVALAVDKNGELRVLVGVAIEMKPRGSGYCGTPGVIAEARLKDLQILQVAELIGVPGEKHMTMAARLPCPHCLTLLGDHFPASRVLVPKSNRLVDVSIRQASDAYFTDSRMRAAEVRVDGLPNPTPPMPMGLRTQRSTRVSNNEIFDPEKRHVRLKCILDATANLLDKVEANKSEVIVGGLLVDGSHVFACGLTCSSPNMNRCGEPVIAARAWERSSRSGLYAPLEAVVAIRRPEVAGKGVDYEIVPCCANCNGVLSLHAPQAVILKPEDSSKDLIVVRAGGLTPHPYPTEFSDGVPPPPLAVELSRSQFPDMW